MSLKRYSILDFAKPLETLYKRGMRKGHSTGWRSIDEHYTVELGQWTVVTGVPGHGKSEWLDAMAVHLAKDGWQFVYFSPENQPHELHAAKILEKWLGKPFSAGPTTRMTHEEVVDTEIELANRFVFMTVDSEFVTTPSVNLVIESASAQIDEWRKHGLGKKVAVVIDPWNEMDHARPSNMTETEYISQTLSYIRQFAREWKIHIFLVAHPTKLSKDKDGKYPICRLWDISGSAHWNNKADNGITVHRDVVNGGPVQIHVLKIRFKHIGKPGVVELNYDYVTGRYHDINYPYVDRKVIAAGGEPCPV